MAFLIVSFLFVILGLLFLPDRFHLFLFTTLVSSFVITVLPARLRTYLKKIGTYVHEVAHGVASWVSGGQFHWFVVRRTGNSSGLAKTSGGARPLIIGAGYVFTPVSGAILLTVSAHGGRVDELLLALAIMTGLITLKAASLSTIVLGLLIAATMALPAVAAPDSLVGVFVLNFLGVTLLSGGVSDLRGLISLSMRSKGQGSDAEAMAQEVGGPALVWALIFTLVTVAFFLATVLYGFLD